MEQRTHIQELLGPVSEGLSHLIRLEVVVKCPHSLRAHEAEWHDLDLFTFEQFIYCVSVDRGARSVPEAGKDPERKRWSLSEE